MAIRIKIYYITYITYITYKNIYLYTRRPPKQRVIFFLVVTSSYTYLFHSNTPNHFLVYTTRFPVSFLINSIYSVFGSFRFSAFPSILVLPIFFLLVVISPLDPSCTLNSRFQFESIHYHTPASTFSFADIFVFVKRLTSVQRHRWPHNSFIKLYCFILFGCRATSTNTVLGHFSNSPQIPGARGE